MNHLKCILLLILCVTPCLFSQIPAVSSGSSSSQIFTFSFPDGPFDQVDVRFGWTAANSCWILYQTNAAYDAANPTSPNPLNWLYLYTDAGTLPWTPGTNPIQTGSS